MNELELVETRFYTVKFCKTGSKDKLYICNELNNMNSMHNISSLKSKIYIEILEITGTLHFRIAVVSVYSNLLGMCFKNINP